jgi:hypothetical protein
MNHAKGRPRGLFLACRSRVNPHELDDVGARWTAAMQRGDFESAWRQTDRIETERRALESSGRFTPQPCHLLWDGTPFDGKDVVVRCSHGLGDTLQFVRYVPLVRARARDVRLLVQPHLLPLFETSAEFGDVRNGWTNDTPPRDVEIEIMELAYAFRSTVETVPRNVPYLPATPLAREQRKLPSFDAGSTLKVGLLWSASEWDTSRSIPLELFAPLGTVAGAKFYSLQQGPERETWRNACFGLEPLHEHTEEIAAAAAAMRSLDLVITVDGMVAHLAGALAAPVWVLLKHQADWRWMRDRADSPWYPTMRLFRQNRPGDWAPVIKQVGDELRALCDSARIRIAAASPYRSGI